jgi:hypothetical protein
VKGEDPAMIEEESKRRIERKQESKRRKEDSKKAKGLKELEKPDKKSDTKPAKPLTDAQKKWIEDKLLESAAERAAKEAKKAKTRNAI